MLSWKVKPPSLGALYKLHEIFNEPRFFSKGLVDTTTMLKIKLILLSLITLVIADDTYETIYCNSTSSCPEDKPCCSQYGTCGTGLNCLGGCNPHHSYKKDACMPMPVCKNYTTDFTSSSLAVDINEYLGDPEDTDWVYSGYLADYDDSIILAMPNQSAGTVLSSTRYVWYGKVSATLKTSHLAGVVTAFILFSNSQDEVDYEFVGTQLEQVETNFFYQGILNNTNVYDVNMTNTFENYHTLEVDWTEDQLTWSIDGVVSRVLKKEDTYNETSGIYYYPQTPSRVQVSLWPAGLATNAQGTIEWAGGEIDWNSDDIKDYGYYYMFLKSVSVECYEPPSYALIEGENAYVYNNSKSFTTEDVMITDDDTVLGSQKASGLDPDEGAESSSSSSSSASSSGTKSGNSSATKTSSNSSSKTSSSSDDNNDDESNESTTTSLETTASATATGFAQFAGSSTTQVSSSNNGSIGSFSLLSIILSIMMSLA